MIDRDKFYPIYRRVAFGGVLKQSQVDGTNTILDAWEARCPDGDLRHLACELGTTVWETAHTMQPVREAFWLSEEWRRVNLRYYPYYGRGLVQLTWEANYDKMGKILDLNLVGYPDLALDPKNAADIMFVGMENGIFTGRRLSDYFTPTVSDWAGARAIINGDGDVDHNGVRDSIDIGNLARGIYEALKA